MTPALSDPGWRWWHRAYRIRYRLLLVNALIVAVPLAGAAFARSYEREMLRALEADMIHQAQLVRALLLADEGGPRLDAREPALRRAARDTGIRIRLLDDAGRLLADSHPGTRSQPVPASRRRTTPAAAVPPWPAEPAERAEVRAARAGRYGAETRVWRAGNAVYLFSALPIARGGRVEGVVYVSRSTHAAHVAMHRLRRSLFRLGLGAMAVTAVLSLVYAATISRPLSRLTRIARRIAAGDRSQRLSLDRRDEIGELARAFDAMTRELDARARDAGELAANLSHEFKSPLTSVRGAAELLLEGAADDPTARARFLRNIVADADRLDRLVTRLLELSRLESAGEPPAPLDYPALIDRVIAALPPGPAVRVRYRAGARVLCARRGQLAAALRNLIDNARWFAAPDTPVTVEVLPGERGWLRTRVHNLGPPISEANLARVWDRFFTTRAGAGGTGLGLPIVKAAAATHGGRVFAASGPGGTWFEVALPAG